MNRILTEPLLSDIKETQETRWYKSFNFMLALISTLFYFISTAIFFIAFLYAHSDLSAMIEMLTLFLCIALGGLASLAQVCALVVLIISFVGLFRKKNPYKIAAFLTAVLPLIFLSVIPVLL